MKKTLFLLIIVSTFQVSVHAQQIRIISGLSRTNVSSFATIPDTKSGLYLEVNYAYFIKNYSLSAGISYHQRGFIDNVVFKDEFGNETGEKATSKISYDYLSLPIKTGLYIGKKIYGFGYIGVVPSLLINAKLNTSVYDAGGQLDYNDTNNMTNSFTKFDISALTEIGGGYKIQDKYRVFTSITFQQSLTTVTSEDFYSNNNLRHYSLTFSIGLSYRLSKK